MIEGLIYLDTNIYSNLAKSYSLDKAISLRDYLIDKGKRPTLSPVNLLEILGTRNEAQRENIIILCQHFCGPELFAEPEALIVDFIVSNKKENATQQLALSNQLSTSELSNTWREVQSDKKRTLQITDEDLSHLEMFKIFQGYLHAFYSRGKRLPELILPRLGDIEEFKETLRKETIMLREQQVPKERMAILCENRNIVSLVIVCACMTPFPDVLEEYWNLVGLDSVADRYSYLKNELSFLNENGPVIGMGSYMGWQATKRHDNGNFFDCLHLLYLPYVDELYTDDPAFHGFRDKYPDAKSLKKIMGSEQLLEN